MTTVHILLATYNGERFLSEQLDSIRTQKHSNWTLTVSDDGSSDNTCGIVTQFANSVSQKVTLLSQQGPSLGPTANFFRLIDHAEINSEDDLIAFCDQDDVWLNDKLERAAQWHTSYCEIPVRLYCSRTQFVTDQLAPIGLSPQLRRAPSFENALVQNIASGNTMVMSTQVLVALRQINPKHSVWHDWTTYLVATALGGKIEFDDKPSLLYRQHANNVIGSNNGFQARLKRLLPILQGRYKDWSDMTAGAVSDISNLLPHQSVATFESFVRMRNLPNPLHRLIAFNQSNIRRQSTASNLSLGLALLLGLA